MDNLSKPATSRGKRGGGSVLGICFFTELSPLSVSQLYARRQGRSKLALRVVRLECVHVFIDILNFVNTFPSR